MPVRKYSSISQETTLVATLTSGASTMVVNNASTLLAGITPAAGETFTVVIDPDTALEEIVDVIAPSTPSSNTLTISRNIDGSTAIQHSAGAKVRHMAIGRDFREPNIHAESTSGVHGVSGDIVGTSGAQTIGGPKTILSPTIDGGTLSGTFLGAATLSGTTLNSATLATPTITNFSNATHSHADAAGGGNIAIAAVTNLQSNLDGKAPTVHTHGLDARNIADHGVVVTQRNTLNFTGNLTVTDDAVNNRTDISITLPPDTSLNVYKLVLMGAI